jgi:bifunctional non-homologous end joining protein LigD
MARKAPKRATPTAGRAGGGEARVTVGGVALSHPDRVLFSEQGATKRDLALYLEAVAPRMLPHLAGRLVSLLRCPEGSEGTCFFQRHAGSGLPDPIKRHVIADKDGSPAEYLVIDSQAGLIAAAQMGVLEFHIWGSRIDRIEEPDRIVFDLDPDPSVDFAAVKAAAHHLRGVLDGRGLKSFALLTGGKGVHVVVPIQRRFPWPVVKGFAETVAKDVAAEAPDRYVAAMSKAQRKGRIFIDYFRNDRSASAIAPYSPRARAGAPVAWPLTWAALDGVAAANAISLETAKARLAEDDPWAGYDAVRQGL